MKVRKKTFKSFKDKYKTYLKQTQKNLEITHNMITNYEPKYGPKELLQLDIARYFTRYNLLCELLDDIAIMEVEDEYKKG